MHRAVMLFLTVVLTLVTASTLLVTAAAIVPPPLVFPHASPAADTEASALTRSPLTAGQVPTTGTAVLMRTERIVPSPAPIDIALARLTYAPGSAGETRALPGLLMLAVESGTLTVSLAGHGQYFQGDQLPVNVRGSLALQAGDGLVLRAGSTANFRNDAGVPVIALAAGVFPSAMMQNGTSRAPMRWIDAASPSVVSEPLAGGWLVNHPAGPVVAELQRLSLQPHDEMPLAAPGATALAVEAGTLSLAVGQALVWRQTAHGPDEWISPASEAVVLAGDGALLQDRPQVTLRNDGSGPLLLIVFAVTPATELPTPSDAMT